MATRVFRTEDPAVSYRRYTRLALLLIVGFSLAGLIAFQLTLWSGSNDSKLINTSGRQRMLSQQLVKDALLLLASDDYPAEDPRRRQIAINLETLKFNHRTLVSRNAASGFGNHYSSIIQENLETVSGYLDGLAEALNDLINGPTVDRPWNGLRQSIKAQLLEHEILYLTSMDYITGLFTQEGQERIDFFRILHLIIFAFNIVLLLVVYFIIFKPFAARLSDYFHELNRTMVILQDQASMDQLTGLYNKRSGMMFLDKEYSNCQRNGSDMTVLFMDLDRLKFVNDTYGHEAGDRLIQSFAATLNSIIRKNDHAFRYGGDEFVLILPGPLNSGARVLARLSSLAECTTADCTDEPEKIGFSWGSASLSENRSRTAEELLHLADKRMYQNKRAKKQG